MLLKRPSHVDLLSANRFDKLFTDSELNHVQKTILCMIASIRRIYCFTITARFQEGLFPCPYVEVFPNSWNKPIP